jgi:serine/threonine-protein kinase SRPK3
MMKLSKLFTGNVIIIDFGEAFFLKAPPEGYSIPAQFCAPELIFLQQNGKPADVWALACTIFEMRAGEPLFESFVCGVEDVLADMVQTLGFLPEKLLMKIEELAWLRDVERTGQELDEMVHSIKDISEDESLAFYDLFRQALRYDTEERLTMDEMLRHPWFSYNLK